MNAACWAFIRARVVSRRDERTGELQRTGELTPYAAETIGEDALRAGPGARLEVTVDAGTNDAGLGRVRDQCLKGLHQDEPDVRAGQVG